MCAQSLSRVQLSLAPWTVAHQAPLSMEFSRKEYWSGLPFLSPGDFSDPGIRHRSPTLRADSLPSELQGGIFVNIWMFVNIQSTLQTLGSLRSTLCQSEVPVLSRTMCLSLVRKAKSVKIMTFALLTTPRHGRNIFWVFLLGKSNIRVYMCRDFIWSNRVDREAEFWKGKRKRLKIFFFGCAGSLLLHMALVFLIIAGLSFPHNCQTRDRTHIPCVGWQLLNDWTTREVPIIFLRDHFFF